MACSLSPRIRSTLASIASPAGAAAFLAVSATCWAAALAESSRAVAFSVDGLSVALMVSPWSLLSGVDGRGDQQPVREFSAADRASPAGAGRCHLGAQNRP